MSGALHKFPVSARDEGKADLLPPPIRPKFSTFAPDRVVELLAVTRESISKAELLLNFVHNNRNVARQAGIETIAIEISSIMQGESFSRVADALEDAAQNGRPLELTHAGLETIRRIESLIAEASMNTWKFTEGDFTVMEQAEQRARSEAEAQRAYLTMEERRLEGIRHELALKESYARQHSDTISSLKSSLSFPVTAYNVSPIEPEKPSSDLSILIPFAIVGAILATVAVVVAVSKEK